MFHYVMTRQERTQIDGRPHNVRAPLCGTGDAHYRGANPGDFRPADAADRTPRIRVDCPHCAERKHLLSARERTLVAWVS